nr:immunoglobulin heavy chain junction region [Mus musculus]MBK4184025.1 immunoglobulin heavy chain junction region [Mus musculus]
CARTGTGGFDYW